MNVLNVIAIPAFTDNYIWLIRGEGNRCAVVDPGDAGPVKLFLEREGLDLRYILITHHHPDHIGGMTELKQATGARVFGPHDDRIPKLEQPLHEGEHAELDELGLRFKVLEVPGHTRSHIVFFGHGCLFSGDTLFSVGCGRLFEGSADQMQTSLDKLAALNPDTLIYCGHEYTQANCNFALAVEPANQPLQEKSSRVNALRNSGKCTLPGRLGEELVVNPFMRSRQPGVVLAAQKREPSAQAGASTLAVIRDWKDRW